MSVDNHKRVSRQALEMWASNNARSPEEIFAENYVNHQEPDVEGGISDKNLEEWKALVTAFHKSFSDSKVHILMQIAEGDLAATRWEFTATHSGDFMGLAPTGRNATWTGVQIDRFHDDKIAESWVSWDKYRFFEGLGLVK
jgi:predicted ester cyclase